VWPTVYLIVSTTLCVFVLLNGDKKSGTALLCGCLALQYFDLPFGNKFEETSSYFQSLSSAPQQIVKDPTWDLLRSPSYRHIAYVPVQLYGCDGIDLAGGYYSQRVNSMAFLAYQKDMTINAGYFSRQRSGINESCKAQNAAFLNGPQDRQTVFVSPDLQQAVPNGLSCGLLDNFLVCVASGNLDEFATSLKRLP
jgi:hypothetical protein